MYVNKFSRNEMALQNKVSTSEIVSSGISYLLRLPLDQAEQSIKNSARYDIPSPVHYDARDARPIRREMYHPPDNVKSSSNSSVKSRPPEA